jgi:Kdo2-lipid IVA lauroyltransferase/acyltransferase
MVLLIKCLAWFFASMPLGMALAFGRGLGTLTGSILRLRRKVVVSQLMACFPEKPRSEIESIASRVYRNQGMNLVEQLRILVIGLDDVEGRVEIRGQENVEKILHADTSALILMAHIGNWEIAGYTTRISNRVTTVVVKLMRNPKVQEYLVKTREKMNVRIIPHKGGFRDCLRAVDAGDVLTIILDQNRPTHEGVFVDFFGRSACTSPGLAVISYKTKLPVYPVFFTRQPNHRDHIMHVLPPIEPPPGRKMDVTTAYTEKYTKVIEDMIRQYPDQWLWMHKRWKTQMPEEQEPARAEVEDEAAGTS